MIEIRLPTDLYAHIVEDLQKPHEFALERVGFVFGKFDELTSDKSVVLLHQYTAVADDDYIENDNYAAAINSESIVKAMQVVRVKRAEPGCVFHIHTHEHKGRPSFSRQDQQGLPPLIPGFLRSAPKGVHGLILLSHNNGIAQVWRPTAPDRPESSSIVLTGKYMRVWS
ncbi:MAG: hypothetical protein QG574_4236 [Cyanobacteriota bacterium erpe_2018_sw_21hr_WHONDRS-SW48-000092_B_bin.40]|nr:hypothetical protein [Cyanobacteriota bacterium erpe_2018_sw_21hr_WHONDRS-SW48-000092_B_bin.40]